LKRLAVLAAAIAAAAGVFVSGAPAQDDAFAHCHHGDGSAVADDGLGDLPMRIGLLSRASAEGPPATSVPCTVPALDGEPPGPGHVALCNAGWPQDGNFLHVPIAADDGTSANPAAGAVASGQWTYAILVKQGGSFHLACVVPGGAVATGAVADQLDDEYPSALVDVFHANGDGRTLVYRVYAVS